MPVWLVVVVVVAALVFWSVLAFVVSVVVGGAFRTSLRSAELRLRDDPDTAPPAAGTGGDETLT